MREWRYRVEVPGYRVREITLVTTLRDAAIHPAEALAEFYFQRWQAEINFRHLKVSMQLDVLRCETVDGVLRESAKFTLAYTLVRSVMVESAERQGVDWIGRHGALVDRDRGGRPHRVGRQPLASRPSRAAGGETATKANTYA